MTHEERREAAWRAYREEGLKTMDRRQIRKREFLAGYDIGAESVQARIPVIVRANVAAREFITAANADPRLVPALKASQPELVASLLAYLTPK